MAVKLGNEVKVGLEVGNEEVMFTLREPTNAELNRFLSGRFSMTMRGKQVNDKSVEARVEFFDLLVTKVSNLEDADGKPMTAEQKDKIPSNWKNLVILEAFENTGVSVKN